MKAKRKKNKVKKQQIKIEFRFAAKQENWTCRNHFQKPTAGNTETDKLQLFSNCRSRSKKKKKRDIE